MRAKEKADLEFQKQISEHICKVFGADIVVKNIISEIGKTPDNEFFTAEYLNKLGIYKIPNGLILDTVQKCRSFVSSLYATALSEHKKRLKTAAVLRFIWHVQKKLFLLTTDNLSQPNLQIWVSCANMSCFTLFLQIALKARKSLFGQS